MKVTDLTDIACPIARALSYVGERWTSLIIRDVIQGIVRFDDLEKSLGISSSMLARRLGQLVEQGLIEKHAYQQRPVRYEYRLTESGRALYPLIIMLFDWGERYASPEDSHEVTMVNRADYRPIDPIVVDRRTLTPLTFESTFVVAGPDVRPPMLSRIKRIQAYWQAHYPAPDEPVEEE